MIENLRLQNFRSYKDASFEFEGGVNIVVGPNASGKTNLLEAILVLAQGGSYRARDADLIQFNKPWVRLDGLFVPGGSRTLKLTRTALQGRSLQGVSKQFVLADQPHRRLSLEQTVPVVIFEPGHLQLLSRGPDYRRDWLDDLLARSQVGYKRLINSYRRALAQRNALLKKPARAAADQLFVWNVRLSDHAGQGAAARATLVEQINKGLSRTYGQIAGPVESSASGRRRPVGAFHRAGRRAKLAITYQNQFSLSNYSSRLLAKLEASTELDLRRGFTAHGPHREDFTIELNRQPAPISASRGEVRSLVLALKIFELGLIAKARDAAPIFLLDDVFSELDGSRRRALVAHLRDHQTIITTTDADAVMEYFAASQNLIALTK